MRSYAEHVHQCIALTIGTTPKGAPECRHAFTWHKSAFNVYTVVTVVQHKCFRGQDVYCVVFVNVAPGPDLTTLL